MSATSETDARRIVYRMTNARGDVIYVGITSDINRRVLEHSEKSWFDQVASVETSEYDSLEEASAAEAELIRRLRPRHNRVHNPGAAPTGLKMPPIYQHDGGLVSPVDTPPPTPPKASTKRFDAFSSRRRYVKLAEAAEYLGVTDRTIRQMIADGRLTGYRSGKRLVRVDLNELDTSMKPFGGGVKSR